MGLIEEIQKKLKERKSFIAKWIKEESSKEKEKGDFIVFESAGTNEEFTLSLEKEETEKTKYTKLILSFIDAGIYDEAMNILKEMQEKKL